MVNKILEKDFVGAKETFGRLIKEKSLSRIGERKIAVASQMFATVSEEKTPRSLDEAARSDYDGPGHGKTMPEMSEKEHIDAANYHGNMIHQLKTGKHKYSKAYTPEKTKEELARHAKLLSLHKDAIEAYDQKSQYLKDEVSQENVEEEAFKEMSLKKVMKKVNDGEWETDSDIKVGKHVFFTEVGKGKKFSIYVTEETLGFSEAAVGKVPDKDFDKSSPDFKVSGIKYYATGKKGSHNDGGNKVREFEAQSDDDAQIPTLWVDDEGNIYADSKSEEASLKKMLED